MTTRHRLTLKEKLEIMVRQARCPRCDGRLGALDGLQWDHVQALARGGTDTVENISAVHIDCHKAKTFGSPATTLGSDIHEIAKTRRLTKEQEAFRARLLAKDAGEEPEREKKKWNWPKRPMGRRK